MYTFSPTTGPPPPTHPPSPAWHHPPGPRAQAYELMICPDQVSCFVPGLRCVIFTSTACTFRFLGGTRETLYVTSSPSTRTYSPSMLKQRKIRTRVSSVSWKVTGKSSHSLFISLSRCNNVLLHRYWLKALNIFSYHLSRCYLSRDNTSAYHLCILWPWVWHCFLAHSSQTQWFPDFQPAEPEGSHHVHFLFAKEMRTASKPP